jgi:phosphinothricin acetyltransferase
MTAADWPQVSRIYREGIATGVATFERYAPTWEQWDAAHLPMCRLVARQSNEVVGWVALTPISNRACYAGVAEFSIYVAEQLRGHGIGTILLQELIAASERSGIWTLQTSTFAANTASIRLQQRCGFRIVGRRERIAQLAGVWHDTVLTERRSSVVGL